MLTTGVDIPDLEFIVFLRPVKSRILFEQMLGRGTRQGDDVSRTSRTSSSSTASTARCSSTSATPPTSPPSRPRPTARRSTQIIEEIWQNRDRDYNIRPPRQAPPAHRQEMSGDARELFARFIPDGDVGRVRRGPAGHAPRVDFTRHHEDPPRRRLPGAARQLPASRSARSSSRQASRTTVESEWLIKAGDRPGVQARATTSSLRAVRSTSNADQIEAICDPARRGRRTGAPSRSRSSARRSPRRPSTSPRTTCRRPSRSTHHKALVDIISMVKRAAIDTSPLLTAEERVNAAVDARDCRPDSSPTSRRSGWSTSASTSSQNLSIDRDDFDDVPVLADRGGWGEANRVFDGAARRAARRTQQGAGSRMTRRRRQALGLLPHASPRRRRLRRLHRADHLPALPQDGRRARHRRCPTDTDWPYLRKQYAAPTSLDAYIEALRTLGKQPGILGDIFAGAQNRFTNPVNLKQAHRPDRRDRVDLARRRRQGCRLRRAPGEGRQRRQEGRRPVLHAAPPDPDAWSAASSPTPASARTSRSMTRPAAPAASSSPPTNGSRTRPAERFDRDIAKRIRDQDLLRPGTRRPAAAPGADEPLPPPGRAAHQHSATRSTRPRAPSGTTSSSRTRRSARRAPTRHPTARTSSSRPATSSSTSSSTS